MSDPVQFLDDVSAPERRIHQRYSTSTFSCVQLGDDNGGIVLDISEQGLSMQVVRGLADDQFARIRFQLMRSGSWVETRARVIWANRSRTTAGVQFDGLSYEGQTLISHWISSIANLKVNATKDDLSENIAGAKSSVGSEAVAIIPSQEPGKKEYSAKSPNRYANGLTASVFAPTVHSKVSVSAITAKKVGFRHGRRWAFVVLFGSLLAGLGIFGLSRQKREQHVGGDNIENPTALDKPSLSADASVPKFGLETLQEPHPVSVVSRIVPGFFLQAGAMKVEENADALVRSLQQKQFPAFILKEAESRFYIVFVGPFPNVENASRMRVRLQEQGFQTIIARMPTR